MGHMIYHICRTVWLVPYTYHMSYIEFRFAPWFWKDIWKCPSCYFKDKLESASMPGFEWPGISALSKKKLFKPSRSSKYQGLLKETFTRRTIKLSRIAHQETKQVKFQPRLTLITLVSLISFNAVPRRTEHDSTYVFSLRCLC